MQRTIETLALNRGNKTSSSVWPATADRRANLSDSRRTSAGRRSASWKVLPAGAPLTAEQIDLFFQNDAELAELIQLAQDA